ncbi:hypothetical protein KSF78_0007854 [Schistosoma japonicum]|nr:hypothetical protein KSF78_0007854 [Schistosoma japonicum]
MYSFITIISEFVSTDNTKSSMIQLNNTISSIRSLSGQLSSDENSSVYTASIFFEMKSSSTENTTCSPLISNNIWTNPLFYVSLSCVIITLLIGFFITFTKKLHTPSTKNTVIIIIAIIATFPIVVVLCYFNYWYYSVIIQIVTSVTIMLSLIPGMYVKYLSSNWRKFLFAIACLFTITGILFTIVGIIFKTDDHLRVSIQIT